MLRLRVNVLREGQHPSERVVAFATADGKREELIVDSRSLRADTLLIGYPVGVEKDRILVELPRETLRGTWRVWVSRNAVVTDEEAAA